MNSNLYLSADHLSVSFGDRKLFDLERLRIYEGDRVGLVGLNGSGKTTLLHLLSGSLQPEEGTVKRGIEIFRELGLVEQLTNGVYYMTNIQMMIGQSSTEGERKKRERMRLARSNLLPETPADICPPELKKEKEKERELKASGTPSPLGRYRNVFLNRQELEELQTEYPDQWEHYVERLSEYMESTGKVYRNHAATIRSWISMDEKKAPTFSRTYTFKEGESL